MQINQNLTKNITETSYLSVENTKRYRPIIRFFYEENEKMNYFLYKEDIFQEFTGLEGFEDYTIEKAESDLSALVHWKNLEPIQDIENVYTLESFKNKKYRYQITEYTIEIERLLSKLESLHIEGSSLEPSLIERLKEELLKIDIIKDKNEHEVYSWWISLNEDFKRINEKYKDYIRSFYNIQLEEIAKSEQFILRKNDLVNYLRLFIKILQENSYKIENVLLNITTETQNIILDKVVKAQSENIRIDKLDEEFDYELVYKNHEDKFINMKNWFVGKENQKSEIVKINDKTTEIIMKITRVASQIAGNNGSTNNRKEDYRKICEMFSKSKSFEESNKLSSVVFGLMSTRHISGNFEYEIEETNKSLIDLEPFEMVIKPRIREYKIKEDRSPIIDKTKHKEKVIKEYMKKLENQRKEFESVIKDSKIELESLGVITPTLRKTLLNLISKASQSDTLQTKTDDGKNVLLVYNKGKENIVIKSLDGELTLPNMELVIK